MSLKRRKRKNEEGTFELNLAPMMDMFVTIIPFMLLSAVFMQLMIIDVPLPQPVAKAVQDDREKKDREVSITVNLGKDGKSEVVLTDVNGKRQVTGLAAVAGEFDYDKIHAKLVDIKLDHPKVFRLEMNPADGVPYKAIVALMDVSRNLLPTDPKVFIVDHVKKEKAEVQLLFPDIVLANLLEN